jgi:hypothetical protein
MKRSLAVVSALAFAATGCGYTELHEAVLRPPTPPTTSVELYLGDQNPNRPFYEVALVEAFGYGTDANMEDLSAALRGRGGNLGCDAILRARFDIGQSMAHGYGVCVKWAKVVTDTIQTTRPVPPAPAPAPATPAQ